MCDTSGHSRPLLAGRRPGDSGRPASLQGHRLTDLVLIEKFALLTPLPVNIMEMEGVPEIPDLARAGVRRVSLGPWP